jgi:hypothetical protein
MRGCPLVRTLHSAFVYICRLMATLIDLPGLLHSLFRSLLYYSLIVPTGLLPVNFLKPPLCPCRLFCSKGHRRSKSVRSVRLILLRASPASFMCLFVFTQDI